MSKLFKPALQFMLMSVIAVLCFMGTAGAMPLPHWPIDYVVLKSEVIAQGHFIDKEHFLVEKVFFGSATPLQTILINDRLALTRIINDSERLCDPVRAINGITGKPCATIGQETAIVFLQKVEGQWEPTGWGSGVKWLREGKVLGYYQIDNPGPYLLIPDFEANTAEDLIGTVEHALGKRVRFEAALQMKPKQRIEGLLPFVEDSKEYLYWKDALRGLARTGPAAGVVVRELADKLKGQYLLVEVLKSMGETGDERLSPYLLEVVAAARPVVKNLGSGGLSNEQRQSAEEWLASLCSIAKLNDRQTLPALREALFDTLGAGEFYGGQARACIEEGLRKMPMPENVVAFRRFYASAPRYYNFESTNRAHWGVLNFLTDHKFPEAVPLLAEQLDNPDSSMREQSHKLLTEIVGTDLGADKALWLQWYAKHQHLKLSSRIEAVP